MMFAVAGVLVCCKEKDQMEPKAVEPTVQQADVERELDDADDEDVNTKEITTEEYNLWKERRKLVNCNDENLIRLTHFHHNIADETLDNWFRDVTGQHRTSTQIEYFPAPTKDLATTIEYLENNKINCYDGWLRVRFNLTKNGVKFSRSNHFTNKRTLYSEPLFRSIQQKLDNLHVTATEIHFFEIHTPILREGKEVRETKLAMRVGYKIDPTANFNYLYYDMSDNPL